MKAMDTRIDNLEKSLKSKDEEITKLKKDVEELQTKAATTEKVQITPTEPGNVHNMMDELSDQEARKCNIICHNIPESSNFRAETRKKYDNDMTIKLLNILEVNDCQDSIKAVKRLGKKDEAKTRPMLVVFNNQEIKDYVLSKCFDLSARGDSWNEVKISPDLTANQRKHDQQVRAEVDKLNADRTEDETLNFLFRAVGKKGQKKIIKTPVQESSTETAEPTMNQWIEAVRGRGHRGRQTNPWQQRGRGQRRGQAREGFRFSTVMLEDL